MGGIVELALEWNPWEGGPWERHCPAGLGEAGSAAEEITEQGST